LDIDPIGPWVFCLKTVKKSEKRIISKRKNFIKNGRNLGVDKNNPKPNLFFVTNEEIKLHKAYFIINRVNVSK